MTVPSESMSAPVTVTRPRRSRPGGNEALIGYLFILPALLGFVVFYLYPAIRGVTISFTDWNLLSAPENVGLANYKELFADEKFWQALGITFKYVLWNVPIQTILALLMAVAMDRVVKSMFVKGLLILPYLLSNVLVAMVFLWLLDPTLGIVNHWLQALGIGQQPFFGTPEQAIPTIAGVNIWRHVGFNALLFFAGLQSIPKSVYEAARIDGANAIQEFFRITLPLLRPVTVFVMVTTLIGSFQIFDTVAVTTQGGPVDSTRVLVWYIYQNAFAFFKMGYATAMSIVLFLMLVVITLFQMKFFNANQSDLE